MKLIPNFAELLHEVKLPTAEKCFFVEDGDEKYISRWIQNRVLICDLEILFEWIDIEYKLKKRNLSNKEMLLAEEVKKRFPVDQWRVIKVFSDHQKSTDTTKKQ